MNHSIKLPSRLTIVFILAVILSGSVLTYFSINNISNLKELTEKRILEEQRELIARFSAAIADNLEKVTAGFSNQNILPGNMKDSLLKRAGEFEFITQHFILGNDGHFIYPNFTGIPQISSTKMLSDRSVSVFTAGEKAEFNEKNLRKARDSYLSGLNYSSGSGDSLKALNALGRVAVKLNNFEDATAYYSLIIADYSTLTDANGIPYIYYALPQLLKITDPGNYEKILPVIQPCLEKMEKGSVPLNYNTEELMSLIADHLKKSTLSNPGDSVNISRLITGIRQQSQFIIIYGEELAEYIINENPDTYTATSGDFKLMDPVSGNDQDFFLINLNFQNPAGFLINRNKLFETILKTDIQSGLEFNYRIELPDFFSSNANGNNLIITSQLTPWFPDQQIKISLIDEDLIKDIISRRSWIYGIASLLLLVAMLLGVALILRDIAREKHLAGLRSDFISNVTHELKTPLTSIRMYVESLMLGRVKSDEGRKEYLSVVLNESERLKRMINNILEFSKMEKEKQEYHPVETRLSDILLSAINDMKYWLEGKGFTLMTEIDRDITVEVDRERFYQVYTNLLSNAIKYSGDSKTISVRLFRNSNEVITEVEDEGIGIAKDNLKKIFEEFYRVERQESGDITGTGLGLTVAREIVESHGGKILVDSEIGKGSKFSVILYKQ
jgi:signal transduction histidine kinase